MMTVDDVKAFASAMQPVLREMENGDIVVDYGRKWFRCEPNGAVTTKEAKGGKVVTRPATSSERLLALGHAAFDPPSTPVPKIDR